MSRKKEPETKIKSQVVVTNRKTPSSGRNDDRGSVHTGEEWENETGNRGKIGMSSVLHIKGIDKNMNMKKRKNKKFFFHFNTYI